MNLNAQSLLKDLPSLTKSLDPAIVFLWRMGLGRLINLWPELTGRTMILIHHAHNNNRLIHTPLNYREIDRLIYCWSFPGTHSEWHMDIIANPQVEIWLPDGWYAGVCEEVTTPEEKLEVLKAGGLSSRITAFVSDAEKVSTEDLAGDCRMARITRQSPRTGTDGPGGLAWLWPLFVVFLLGIRPKRRG